MRTHQPEPATRRPASRKFCLLWCEPLPPHRPSSDGVQLNFISGVPYVRKGRTDRVSAARHRKSPLLVQHDGPIRWLYRGVSALHGSGHFHLSALSSPGDKLVLVRSPHNRPRRLKDRSTSQRACFPHVRVETHRRSGHCGSIKDPDCSQNPRLYASRCVQILRSLGRTPTRTDRAGPPPTDVGIRKRLPSCAITSFSALSVSFFPPPSRECKLDLSSRRLRPIQWRKRSQVGWRLSTPNCGRSTIQILKI